MEVKKLKPNVEYATCDGTLVMLEGERPELSALHREYNEKQKAWVNVRKPYDRQDPWGGCMNAKKPPIPEVKMREFSVDRDGKKIGDGFITYLVPRDIKGTWGEFLVLYAHRVRERYDAKAENDRLEHIQKTREARLKTVLRLENRGDAHISVIKPYSSDKDRRTRAQIHIYLDDAEELDAFIDALSVRVSV